MVLLTHRTARRSAWQRVLLSFFIGQLLVAFLVLVVYLGRHAGT